MGSWTGSHPWQSRSLASKHFVCGPRAARQHCRAESLPSDGTVKKSNNTDLMKRLAKAREYKDGKASTATPAPPPSAAAASPQAQDPVLERLGDFAAQQAVDEAAKFLTAQQELAARTPPPPVSPPPPEIDRAFRGGAGTADQAANWLQTLSSQGTASQLDTNLRPEEFTMQKEAQQRQQGATIERATGTVSGTRRTTYTEDGYGLAQQQDEAQASMAADRAADKEAIAAARAAESEEEDGAPGSSSSSNSDDPFHKPAVATWGVFPRPRNISEAYGGGRNLPPGQELETEEETAARKLRVSAALVTYRKQMGLDIDPAVEVHAVALFQDGEVLFKDGRLTAALEKFSAAAELVPLRSRIGGQANLQKAICLDSLGRNTDAYSIYTKLEGHTAPGVSKASRRMLFGFKAAENLKVATMSYDGGGTQAWKQYFDRISTGEWAAYTSSEEESEEDKAAARAAALLAAGVVLAPLAFVAFLIAQ